MASSQDRMQFYPTERAALFIDGANLHAAARSLGFDIDFLKLRGHFAAQTRLVRAMYYTLMAQDPEYNSLRPLVDWLSYNGFSVVTKQPKTYSGADGRPRFKGSIGVDLTVDAMRLAPHLDHVVLVAGDGDYRKLVEDLQNQGRRVTLVSTVVVQPPLASDELRRQADFFIELAQLKQIIARTDPVRRSADATGAT